MKVKKLNLDTCRLITAFLIVAVHTYPLTSINETLDFLFTHVFCRIGVPFFLMLTGYFILPKSLENKKSLINYTKKIIKIYIISILVYIPINIYAGHLSNLNILDILKMIFIDGTMYHLWYFPGLIIGLWITYYLCKKTNIKNILPIVISLFILGLLGDSYYGLTKQVLFLKELYKFIFQIFNYTRNGLFYCPIFLYLGYTFTKKEKENNSLKKNIIITFSLFITMLTEGYILHFLNLQKHDSMYITLIPLMYFIFNIIINTNNTNNKELRNISTILYIMHPFFIVIVRLLGKLLHIEEYLVDNSLIHYFLVLSFTLIFSIIFEKTKKQIKTYCSNNK